MVTLAWSRPGLQKVWVTEQSITTDTVCVGVSDTLLVDLYVDSSRLAMGRISVDVDDPTRIIGEGFADFHPLADVQGLQWQEQLNGGAISSAPYVFTDSVRFGRAPVEPATNRYRYRMFAINSCGDTLQTDWHQLVQLQGDANGGEGPISLNWSAYEGWPVASYEVWRLTERSDWTLLEILPGGQLDFCGRRYPRRIGTSLPNPGLTGQWRLPFLVQSRLNFVLPHPITVSNVFTPNGDGINETFFIRNLELYPDHQLDIFDRWGRRVFTAAPYQNDWAGEGLKAGTYYYSFRVQSAAVAEISRGTAGLGDDITVEPLHGNGS